MSKQYLTIIRRICTPLDTSPWSLGRRVTGICLLCADKGESSIRAVQTDCVVIYSILSLRLISCHLTIYRLHLACYAKCCICAQTNVVIAAYLLSKVDAQNPLPRDRRHVHPHAPALTSYIREVHQTITSKVICHGTISACRIQLDETII